MNPVIISLLTNICNTIIKFALFSIALFCSLSMIIGGIPLEFCENYPKLYILLLSFGISLICLTVRAIYRHIGDTIVEYKE